jgi:nicotinate-nucleotide adenylyltransferase
MYLIIGADREHEFPASKMWGENLCIAIICVADRAHYSASSLEFEVENANSTRFRQLNLPAMAISTTDIRAKISASQSVTSLVCKPVARYIADHHLYQTA